MKQFCVIGIDPTRYWCDGLGYWRDEEDGKEYVDSILVCLTKEEAYWIAKDNGQICYLYVDTEAKKTNGYLVGADNESELKELYTAGKITGYTVFHGKPKDNFPQIFTVVDTVDGLPKKLQERAKPIFYEFIYVR
jgi:hypothetical protein